MLSLVKNFSSVVTHQLCQFNMTDLAALMPNFTVTED